MRIKIHIELTEEDLPFADLLEVIIGDVQETFTDSDEVDDIQIVVEEHPPQTYFDGQHGCEEEIEEEPIQDVVDVQETVTETIVEEVEETPPEEVEPVRKEPMSLQPARRPPSLPARRGTGRRRRQTRPTRGLSANQQLSTIPPTLKDVGLPTEIIALLKEHNVINVGDFVETGLEELQFFTQIVNPTEIEQYQRKGKALIRAHEHACILNAQRIQAEKEKEEANETRKWTPEMNSRESLIHYVWQAIPDRKSGVYTSLDISRYAFDTITGKYDVSETAVDGEGLYQAAQSVLKAIYDASDTPDFLLGKDGQNGGALVLVVLTNAGWPPRSSLQLEA